MNEYEGLYVIAASMYTGGFYHIQSPMVEWGKQTTLLYYKLFIQINK